MGTSFIVGATKQDIVKGILDDLKATNSLLASKVTEEDGEPVLWTAERRQHKPSDETDERTFQFIGCYVLRQDNEGNWGYKGMDESVGPCFYSVPVKWLNKYPCNIQTEYSREWREEVRQMTCQLT